MSLIGGLIVIVGLLACVTWLGTLLGTTDQKIVDIIVAIATIIVGVVTIFLAKFLAPMGEE